MRLTVFYEAPTFQTSADRYFQPYLQIILDAWGWYSPDSHVTKPQSN